MRSLLATAALAVLLAAGAADAQSIGGWNESLSGSPARAMNPSPHAQRDSRVRSGGYLTWSQRLSRWLMDPAVVARHRRLDDLMRRSDELDRRSRNTWSGTRDRTPGQAQHKF